MIREGFAELRSLVNQVLDWLLPEIQSLIEREEQPRDENVRLGGPGYQFVRGGSPLGLFDRVVLRRLPMLLRL